MLILGRRYKFTRFELRKMIKKFKSIKTVAYENKEPNELIEEIKEAAKRTNSNLVILNIEPIIKDELVKVLTKLSLHGLKFMTLEHFMFKHLDKYYIDYEHPDPKLLDVLRPYTKTQYIQKRAVDFFGIFWLLFFSWPVIVYSFFRIKKESPGPILFWQDRVGAGGDEFSCVKLRSMYIDAEKHGAQFASFSDPRVFKYGEFIRKTRIDELPQMWNVLKGDMHLIGPRPERKWFVEEYEEKIPYYEGRYQVAPGVTGWAQVNYPYGSNLEDTRQKLMYDLYYVRNWSIWLELKIVWMTAKTVISGKGI